MMICLFRNTLLHLIGMGLLMRRWLWFGRTLLNQCCDSRLKMRSKGRWCFIEKRDMQTWQKELQVPVFGCLDFETHHDTNLEVKCLPPRKYTSMDKAILSGTGPEPVDDTLTFQLKDDRVILRERKRSCQSLSLFIPIKYGQCFPSFIILNV